jgi:hypothetical protein
MPMICGGRDVAAGDGRNGIERNVVSNNNLLTINLKRYFYFESSTGRSCICISRTKNIVDVHTRASRLAGHSL